MNELEFQNILKEKGIEVSEHQLQQFQKYISMIQLQLPLILISMIKHSLM